MTGWVRLPRHTYITAFYNVLWCSLPHTHGKIIQKNRTRRRHRRTSGDMAKKKCEERQARLLSFAAPGHQRERGRPVPYFQNSFAGDQMAPSFLPAACCGEYITESGVVLSEYGDHISAESSHLRRITGPAERPPFRVRITCSRLCENLNSELIFKTRRNREHGFDSVPKRSSKINKYSVIFLDSIYSGQQ